MTTEGLAADRLLLNRTSTAERVAAILRSRISEGYFLPGARLAEDTIGTALGVSRNTLREAFRLLSHERLLVHELNRGVFVRTLSIEDVIDLYRVRVLVECGVVRTITEVPRGIDQLVAAVSDGEEALRRQGWQALGTANLKFHEALVALAESPRTDELMGGVLAELRLVFHVMADPKRFHEPYLARNKEILALLQQGDGPAAAEALAVYLRDAEEQLVKAYRDTQPSTFA
ncbi:GntR family transcriptional regulator [Pseudonocardia xinjiangensis]|uniref:GntR family transcriptional regulator n=1 Tax=Pseudonocardia xinjiangensis TaxID=75289 RepID=A0ABX1RJB3_9PSEU|nr:GntR family transcriptional regulator [Pseudonocardia xinjiangensis]NMH80034.1 GntR family transcriptional regulator [Pseudonocardia xinjiangensis]